VFVEGAKLSAAPNLLLQKLPAAAFVVETLLELAMAPGSGRAGLVVAGDSNAAIAVEATARGLEVALYIDDVVVERAELGAGPVRLRLEFASGGKCRFGFATGSAAIRRMQAEFQAKRGRWIGTKVGLFALALGAKADGHADFDYFRFHEPA
jgi:hypothetical protein